MNMGALRTIGSSSSEQQQEKATLKSDRVEEKYDSPDTTPEKGKTKPKHEINVIDKNDDERINISISRKAHDEKYTKESNERESNNQKPFTIEEVLDEEIIFLFSDEGKSRASIVCSKPLRLGSIFFIFCSLTYLFAFSLESKTFSTLIVCISDTFAMTTQTLIGVNRTSICLSTYLFSSSFFKSLNLFLIVTSVTPDAAAISFCGIFSSVFIEDAYSTVAAKPIGSFPAVIFLLTTSSMMFKACCFIFSLIFSLFATVATHFIGSTTGISIPSSSTIRL